MENLLCSNCHQELKRVKWNTVCDILICPSIDCSMVHTPQGTIPVPKRTRDELKTDDDNVRGKGNRYSKKEKPEMQGGDYGNTILLSESSRGARRDEPGESRRQPEKRTGKAKRGAAGIKKKIRW